MEDGHREIKREFVRQLCTLDGTTPTDADIKHVLQGGAVKANELLDNCCQQLEHFIRTYCMQAERRILRRRGQWCQEVKDRDFSFFPVLSRPYLEVTTLYPDAVSLVDYDIMPYLDSRVSATIQDFHSELDSAVSLWRRGLLAMIREDAEKEKPATFQILEERKRAVELARATLQGQYQPHRQTVCPEN